MNYRLNTFNTYFRYIIWIRSIRTTQREILAIVYSQRVTAGLMGTYLAMAPSEHVDYVFF